MEHLCVSETKRKGFEDFDTMSPTMNLLTRHSLFTLLFILAGAGCNPGRVDYGRGDAGDDSLSVADTDRDTLSDDDEGKAKNIDTDKDGVPDYMDSDSDGDGLNDALEAGDKNLRTLPADNDGDGVANFRDLDSDGNGILDGIDTRDDLDNDGLANVFDVDDDGDSLPDSLEMGPNPSSPRDSDADGTPDFHDFDSDNDSISDLSETLGDLDKDGTYCAIDTDCDGDGISDTLEAGDQNLNTLPIDSDSDGYPDFMDRDSDGDGLLDSKEDKNGNGLTDANETSRTLSDTDGDGVTDLVESAAGSNPRDPSDSPRTRGGFVFVVPYKKAPTPEADTLSFATNITQADVFISMDTTGSMGEEINNLKATLSNTIVPSLTSSIPNLALGVSEYRDFPAFTGNAADMPFRLHHRVMTAKTAAGLQSIQNAVNVLSAFAGGDGPESGYEALYQIATGAGTTQSGAFVPSFQPTSAPPLAVPAGEAVGTLGGAGFRAGALPIVVQITDAVHHNSITTGAFDYPFPSASYSQALMAMKNIGGKMVGIASRFSKTTFGQVRDELTYVANELDAVVSPSAWDQPGIARPSTCAADQCCTGIDGAGLPAVNGKCPLVFDAQADGSGIGLSIVQAIKTLTRYSTIDISASGKDDASDSVDAVAAFIKGLRANTSAGAPCATGLVAIDANSDGLSETFKNVLPGTRVCFDVLPKTNTTVAPTTEPQMFKATISVMGDGVTTLDSRDVYFLVPPSFDEEELR